MWAVLEHARFPLHTHTPSAPSSPRLKMGLCEGVPGSIGPDHLGRADYHGASVNLAARLMDAGVVWGMTLTRVVCFFSLTQFWCGNVT